MAALKYWVWLTTLPGLSNRSRLLLLERYGSPEDVYYADPEELAQVEGLTPGQAALLADKSLSRADRILADCARGDMFLLTMQDAAYPARLRDIFDPPVLLYGKGSLPLFDEEAAIAVVGTRSCTPYGLRCAHRMGYELARQGAVVVSGMAKGIDGAAMRGALQAGASPPPCWAAAWTWYIPRKTADYMRISPPPACCCRNIPRERSPCRGISPCETASSAV